MQILHRHIWHILTLSFSHVEATSSKKDLGIRFSLCVMDFLQVNPYQLGRWYSSFSKKKNHINFPIFSHIFITPVTSASGISNKTKASIHIFICSLIDA